MAGSQNGATACLGLLCALVAGGCSPASGLLLRPGPHKLLSSARAVSQAAARPWPLPRELSKQLLPEYQVAAGDVLLVELVDPSLTVRLPSDQPVRSDGTIDLGPYGRLVAAGRTLEEIRAEAEERIAQKDKKAAAVTVRLLQPESQVYYVLGEVNSPGAYPLAGRETALDAIMSAGDLTDRANRQKIVLSRPTAPNSCRVVLPICYRRIVQLGDTSTNYQLLPGDRIFVASLTFWEELLQMCGHGAGERCLPCDLHQTPCYPTPIGKETLEAGEEFVSD